MTLHFDFEGVTYRNIEIFLRHIDYISLYYIDYITPYYKWFSELNTNVENDPEEEKEYAKVLARDYSQTPLARANPQAKVRTFTGAWPVPSEMPLKLREVLNKLKLSIYFLESFLCIK